MTKMGANTVRNIVPIMGIRIDSGRRGRVLNLILKRVNANSSLKSCLVVTPNPEIVLRAQSDYQLARILNTADFSFPDGIGLVVALRYLALREPNIPIIKQLVAVAQGVRTSASLLFDRKWLFKDTDVVPGRALFEALAAEAGKSNLKVFLLGGENGVARIAALRLAEKYAIKHIQSASGPMLDEQGMPRGKRDKETENYIKLQINSFKPDLLFVAFGPPKQEKWLSRNLTGLNVKVAMVVGGAFDYLAGKTPLPPKFIENLGLEWLWRLITQPWRVQRTFNAVVVFPWRVFLEKLRT